jgi:chromosome segregation ATPase
MINLKEQIKKIYDFVNIEFDIENKTEIESIKQGLELEKIETLDNMLKDYNKQVIKLKRKEQQKLAQKAYKNIQTNLKLEEYKKFEEIASIDNISISELTKKALYAFIKPKTVSSEELSLKNELEGFKARYEALESHIKVVESDKKLLEEKKLENEIKHNSLKAKYERVEKAFKKLGKDLIVVNNQIEKYKSLNIFKKLLFKF